MLPQIMFLILSCIGLGLIIATHVNLLSNSGLTMKTKELEKYFNTNKEEEMENNNYNEVLKLRKEVDKLKKQLSEKEEQMNQTKSKAKEEIEWILSDD